MNIGDLLKYQEVEINILNIEKKLNETEQYKLFAKYESEKKQAMQAIQSLDRDAEKLVKDVNSLEIDIKETIDRINKIKSEINSVNDLAKLDLLERNLIEYNRLLQKDNKDLTQITSRLNYIIHEAQKNVEKHKEISVKEKDVYTQLKDLKNELDIESAPFKELLSELKERIHEKALELYENAKRNNKFQMVTLKEKGYCTGCGQDVELEVGKKIEENGYAECPRCFRVLYVEEK